MKIPTYVITGFFESGKTTLLNRMLEKATTTKVLLLQFESGFEQLIARKDHLQFSKKMLETDLEGISKTIQTQLQKEKYDEVWIEWNCFEKIQKLEELALLTIGKSEQSLDLKKVIYVANTDKIKTLIRDIGGATIEQLAMCDAIVLRNYEQHQQKYHMKQIIREINPDAKIMSFDKFSQNYYSIYTRKIHPLFKLVLSILLISVAYIALVPIAAFFKLPLNAFTNIFIGVVFQAIPFLLLGVIISSLIQVFLSENIIERWFPKNMIGGMVVAIIFGFCLPVCDCASIPIFKSLVRKGVPLSAAVTFMIVSPIINPVVILSTMHAFPSTHLVVISRLVLGVFCSVCIGLFFSFTREQKIEKFSGVDFSVCNCGCYIGMDNPNQTFMDKVILFFRHSQIEFLNIGKYIIMGCFVATIVQLSFNKIFFVESTESFIKLLLIMMAMAFILSLCSSSDAIIARGFSSSFPLGALLGFLVFGPMIDLKNIFLLSSSFSAKFILKLALVSFGVCFVSILLYTQIFLGGW